MKKSRYNRNRLIQYHGMGYCIFSDLVCRYDKAGNDKNRHSYLLPRLTGTVGRNAFILSQTPLKNNEDTQKTAMHNT